MLASLLRLRFTVDPPCILYSRCLKRSASTHRLGLVGATSSASGLVEAEDDAFFNGTTSLPSRDHPLYKIRSEMMARVPNICTDNRNNEQAVLLWNTLADFLPETYIDVLAKKRITSPYMPPGYQLIYFPFKGPLSSLTDDGTDPAHSPGAPYNRLMWAGGFMHFDRPVRYESENRECIETIRNVEVKGREGDEKVFVTLKRCIVEGDSAPLTIEGRTLAFIRKPLKEESHSKPRLVKPPSSPDFSHTLTPTAGLLFRFSALSYNAHRIHLDREYCQREEGHHNVLVHGPLTLILMLEMLAGHIAESSEEIMSIKYKNLAPLYAEEAMTVCGKQRALDEYEVWIQGREGGLAVKGSVKTYKR